ncbi:MAG: 1-acyl-sn-glycerol-3-phosphate acyltransferase [Bacteroidales bacterium]|nr:1-acyl-sn-glycerol-3-phosphate acyltransferase [Bacteroidales bacterium]
MQTTLKSFLVSLYIWTFILASILPLFLIYFVLWFICLPFDRKKAITHGFTVLWTRLYLTLNPFWKIRLKNPHRINPAGKYILISNHQSVIDIALLLQLRINFKWVSKMELAYVPVVGWVIWLNDHILVRRGDKQSVNRMAEACKRTLNEGMSVFMFPEGTRTGNGELQTFKEGAFILARNNEVPILPVVLDGAGRALPRKGFWFRVRQTFTISVLDEIQQQQILNMEIPDLIDYTRQLMKQELEVLRTETGAC